MYDTPRIIIEVASAIICFILVRFMIKPYRLTGEGRYLGLPLGFAFLGISYVLAAFAYSWPYYFAEKLWIPFLARTFAFVFLATTYYFSKKPSKNTRLFWDITLSLLIVALATLFLVGIITPQSALNSYEASQVYIRIFNVICLSYIAIHTLRSHVKKPEPTTIWIPLGFILFAINQYSLLFWYIDSSLAAFTGALVLRLAALAVFLLVSYQAFYSSRKRADK